MSVSGSSLTSSPRLSEPPVTTPRRGERGPKNASRSFIDLYAMGGPLCSLRCGCDQVQQVVKPVEVAAQQAGGVAACLDEKRLPLPRRADLRCVQQGGGQKLLAGNLCGAEHHAEEVKAARKLQNLILRAHVDRVEAQGRARRQHVAEHAMIIAIADGEHAHLKRHDAVVTLVADRLLAD